MDENIVIYCLSFEGSERKNRMIDRFNKLGLSDRVTFQNPVPLDDPLIDFYLQKRGELTDPGGRRAASGTISYLKMIKSFIESGKSYGVFCEDDIHIRKTIKKDLPEIISVIKDLTIQPEVVLLGYLAMVSPKDLGFPLYQENPPSITNDGGFSLMSYPLDLWGGQMIFLSRENAIKAIEKFDKPFHLSCPNSGFVLDWTLTKLENRLLVYPMLGVEEGEITDSHPGQIYFHRMCHQLNYQPDSYI